jgi:hypothetical protein
VRLWDPAGEWKVGDHVIVSRREDEGFEVFVGEIVGVEASEVKLRLDVITYPTCDYLPGSLRASAIRDAAKACPCSAGRQACMQADSLRYIYLQTDSGR